MLLFLFAISQAKIKEKSEMGSMRISRGGESGGCEK